MKQLHVNSWDAYEKAMVDARCRVAVDAGANDGGYTKTLLEKGFFVHAFEPVPTMYDQLVAKHGANPECACFNLGLSDRIEIVRDVTVLEAWTIGQPGDGGLSVCPAFVGQKPFDMKTTTLDQHLDGDPIGILKLDVDGAEFKVLRGATNTLKTFKPVILCEFGFYLEKLGESPQEFVQFIFDLGYKVVSMDGRNVFTTWLEIEPQYPHNTTFDVMLLPR